MIEKTSDRTDSAALNHRIAGIATHRTTAIIIALIFMIAGLIMAVHNDRLVKADKLQQATVQAKILASSIAAPLAFDDKAALTEYLNALRASPEILAAGAYDGQGVLVAGFSASGTDLPRSITVGPANIRGLDLIVTGPVAEGDTHLGAVYLRLAMESWPRRAIRYLGIALIVLMASLLVAVLGTSYASLRQANGQLQNEIDGREQAEAALRQAQKMEAMGQLTGGVAHDFNNLLMVAAGGLDLLERTSDPARIEKLKSGIRQAIDRGAKLTQQLLTFARRSPMHPEVIHIGERIRGMDSLLERSLGEDIRIETRLAPDLWPIEVDPSQLEVALLNIAINARDAMSRAGTITIVADNIPAQGVAQDHVRISVTDQGIGMDAEMIGKIFEPFFTTKGAGHGTGLGLSQVYGFARASEGEVQVDSVPGQGTTMTLLLPRSQKPLPVSKNTQAALPVPVGQRRILLVEDDDNVADMVTAMLEELGYASARAENGDVAFALLSRDQGFDLVVSDMVMPGALSGIELVRLIKERWPELPALLMTGYSSAAALAANEGIALLVKPYTIQELSTQIETMTKSG